MKRPLLQVLGLLCFLASNSLFAQNYYWVGGSGSWDEVSHWATTTGGSTKHASPPTSANDVFFDANSFTEADQSVTITSGATCRSMDWTGATNSPEIHSFFEDLNVYGSLIIPASVQRNFTGNIHLLATSGSYNIDLDDLPLSTPNNETLYFDGSGGTWTFQDNVSIYYIIVNAGTVNTNGKTVTCSAFKTGSTSTKTLNLGSSGINCAIWDIPSTTTNLTLNPGTSTINSTFRVTGKGYTYNNLVISGTVEVYDNNTWNAITLNAGSILKLQEGSTQTITDLISNGTSGDPITIQSVTAGASATLSSASAITISNANIKDNTATGGPFTANNSTNLGNVTGWTIPIIEPATQASSAAILGATTSEIIFRWTSGSGANRIVLAKAEAAVDATPTDGTSYTAGAFGAAEIGSSNYVVYSGNSDRATIIGLTPGVTYHFAVFEFNGTGAATNYLVTSPARTSEPTLASTAIVMSNISYTRCSGKLYSSRGIWNYASNENYIQTLTPATDGNKMRLTFVNFSLGSGDILKIYDGADTNAPLIGTYTGSTSPGQITATNSGGLLTLHFTSDTFVQGNFEADIACIDPNPSSEPTVGASDLVFSAVTATSMTLTWTSGNGSKRIIIAKVANPNGSIPMDGETYQANSSFGSGPGFRGSSQYAVYNGSGNTVTVTNLTPGVSYQYSIYEYNDGGTNPNYRASSLNGTNATTSVTLATEPTVATSGFTFSDVTTSSMTLSWTVGNGAQRIVYAFEGTTAGAPGDGNEYVTSTVFGSGAILAGRGYAVYVGTGTSVNITGLNPGTFYSFAAYEFNGSGTSTNYRSAATTFTNTLVLEPTLQTSNVTTSSVGTTSFHIDFTRGNGARLLVVARQGSAVDAFPVDGTQYTAASGNFSTGQDIGGGNKIVYTGSGSEFILFGLTADNTYHLAFFEFNGFGTSELNYLTSNPAITTRGTLSAAPTVAASDVTFSNVTFDSFTINWSNGNGQGRLVTVAKGYGGSPTVQGGTSFSTSTVFGQGASTGTDSYAVYAGSENSVTVTGLSAGSLYSVYVFEYNGTGNTINYTGSASGVKSTLIYKPTMQASSLAVSDITSSSMTLNWSRGDGHYCVLLARETTAITTFPKDSTEVFSSSYQTTFGSGSDLGNGTVVLYYGSGTTYTVTGLNPASTYHFAVVEVNTGATINDQSYNYFNTTSPAMASGTTLPGKDYYWVGGTGKWSQLTHWATSSGGATLHLTLPTSADNVYFDDKSFIKEKDSVLIDQSEIYCKTMDWSGVLKDVLFLPHLASVSQCGSYLYIGGSLLLSNKLTIDVPNVRFTASTIGNVIDMADKTTFNINCSSHISFDGYRGEWTLNGRLNIGYLEIYKGGRLTAQKTVISTSGISTYQKDFIFDFQNSTINLGSWDYGQNAIVNGGILRFTYSTNLFEGGGRTYDKVIVEGGNGSVIEIKGGATIDSLAILPGQKVIFESEKIFHLNKLTANGDSLRVIEIKASNPGTAALLQKTNGSIDVNYVMLADNVASGGAQFNATNSVALTNVSGWNITNPSVVFAPGKAPSSLVATKVYANNLKLAWAPGNGTGRIVVMKENGPVDRFPVHGTHYLDNVSYGSGSDLGNGNFVVYKGSLDSLAVSNLQPGTIYYIAVFEYNSWAGDIKYLLSPASGRTSTLNLNDIIISNSNVTVCSARYYDDGGNGFQAYYKQYTQTIYPETVNTKLGLLFSNIEIPHYDSLIVYDGIDTAAPILAKLSSSSVPPLKIVAQNSSGALTFSLHPNMNATHYGGSPTGWKAELFCSGTPSPEPGTQVSNLTITNITGNSLTVNMTKGNGVGRILVAREATAVNKLPIDGAYLSSNAFFGKGADLGDGNYIIYAGSEESVTVTGLKNNTDYHFSAYEFAGTGPFVNYLTTSAPTIKGTTVFSKPTIPSTNLQFSLVGPNSMRLAFNPGDGTSRLIVMSKSNITFVPVDGVSYQTDSQLGTGERVAYVGNFFHIDIYNLEQLTQYNFAVFEFNGVDTETKYLTTPLSGSQSTVGPSIVLKKLNATYCPNEKVTASFTITGTFTNNSFVLQLSNELGSFDNPVVLADTAYTFLSYPNIINAKIPNNIQGGSGYKVRIISTSPQTISDSVRNISIPVVPDPAFIVQDSTFISSIVADQFQWMRNGAVIPGANGDTFKYSLGGIYSLVVTENGCSKVSQTFLVTGTDDTFSNQAIKIYPNPVHEKMILEKPIGKGDYYQIYNTNGKVVDEGAISDQRNPLDVTRLVPGMYLIRVRHKGRSITRTFTKE